ALGPRERRPLRSEPLRPTGARRSDPFPPAFDRLARSSLARLPGPRSQGARGGGLGDQEGGGAAERGAPPNGARVPRRSAREGDRLVCSTHGDAGGGRVDASASGALERGPRHVGNGVLSSARSAARLRASHSRATTGGASA